MPNRFEIQPSKTIARGSQGILASRTLSAISGLLPEWAASELGIACEGSEGSGRPSRVFALHGALGSVRRWAAAGEGDIAGSWRWRAAATRYCLSCLHGCSVFYKDLPPGYHPFARLISEVRTALRSSYPSQYGALRSRVERALDSRTWGAGDDCAQVSDSLAVERSLAAARIALELLSENNLSVPSDSLAGTAAARAAIAAMKQSEEITCKQIRYVASDESLLTSDPEYVRASGAIFDNLVRILREA